LLNGVRSYVSIVMGFESKRLRSQAEGSV